MAPQEGELFAAHGDFSRDGTRSSAGFLDAARLATLFVYLNDVPRGEVVGVPGPVQGHPKGGAATNGLQNWRVKLGKVMVLKNFWSQQVGYFFGG